MLHEQLNQKRYAERDDEMMMSCLTEGTQSNEITALCQRYMADNAAQRIAVRADYSKTDHVSEAGATVQQLLEPVDSLRVLDLKSKISKKSLTIISSLSI